jgi:tetratricopeptide (TPR) repeat protein
MDSRRITRALILSLLLFLTGCGVDMLPQSPTPLPSPTPTIEAPATPTPSPEPTVVVAAEPTETPYVSPTPVPFPPRPEDLADYSTAIISYLNDSQGDVDGLREMLKEWGALRNVADLLSVDVDDDGKGELLLIIVDAVQEYGINRPGELLVIDVEGQEYELAYRAPEDSFIMDPFILEVDDINRDGRTEIAFTSTSCGAHTCFTTVYIIASGTGMYEDLTDGDIEMSYADIYFSDWDGDGTPELVMYGGTIGSIGAGPQRTRTEVYRWDGLRYVLSETIYDPSNFLYFKVLDANQALLNGEYESAAALYREAIENPDLVTWMDESKREELTAFALYRLSLTYLLLGETGQAQLARDKLLTQHPEHIYAQVMGVLWDTYLMDDDLREACEAVGSFAAAHPETAEVLAEYGYGNPTFTPEEVCPITLF